MKPKMLQRIQSRQRELQLTLALSWCVESHEPRWMVRGLARLKALEEKIRKENPNAAISKGY